MKIYKITSIEQKVSKKKNNMIVITLSDETMEPYYIYCVLDGKAWYYGEKKLNTICKAAGGKPYISFEYMVKTCIGKDIYAELEDSNGFYDIVAAEKCEEEQFAKLPDNDREELPFE